MKTLLDKIKNIFRFADEKTPTYGWGIFALDDRIKLTRSVIEQQRKDAQQLF